jgi:predicted translin family RNA/ssDNA-binding protein
MQGIKDAIENLIIHKINREMNKQPLERIVAYHKELIADAKEKLDKAQTLYQSLQNNETYIAYRLANGEYEMYQNLLRQLNFLIE